jgi:predicted nucleic acid-binding protein
MRIYLDTSAYAKRYIDEPGSERVIELIGMADPIILSALCLPEMASALYRYVRERSLPSEEYGLLKRQLMRDLRAFETHAVTEEILLESVRCIEKGAVRTLDAIHLATARHIDCDLFLTADRRQYDMAIKSGLRSELVG